jgi:hypothetical protein
MNRLNSWLFQELRSLSRPSNRGPSLEQQIWLLTTSLSWTVVYPSQGIVCLENLNARDSSVLRLIDYVILRTIVEIKVMRQQLRAWVTQVVVTLRKTPASGHKTLAIISTGLGATVIHGPIKLDQGVTTHYVSRVQHTCICLIFRITRNNLQLVEQLGLRKLIMEARRTKSITKNCKVWLQNTC